MKSSNLLSQLATELPFQCSELVIPEDEPTKFGLIIIDEVNGFCTPGSGNLAPPAPDAQVDGMVEQTLQLAREFSNRKWPLLAFVDTHDPDKPEHPYPPHCIRGSGEDELVPGLKWLESDPSALVVRKDCIDGFIGAMQEDGSNVVTKWIKENQIQQLLVAGICTDICVLDFVATVLSARNHGLLAPLEQVLVHSNACATYHLPQAHPQDLTHYLGLYFSASRGAKIINKLSFLGKGSQTNGFHHV